MTGSSQLSTELPARTAVEQVSLAATAAGFGDDDRELLVIAIRPHADSRRVLASPGNSAVRAAISVAVAAGNTRPWSDADRDGVTAVSVAALPEIIRSSVEPCGLHTIDVGVVYAGDEVAAYTMWLAPGAFPTAGMRSRHEALLGHLRAAATEDHERALEEAKLAAARAAARAAEAADRDANRPDVVGGDLLGSLPDRDQLDLMISELETDQAAVLVLGIDDADELVAAYGADGMEQVRQIVAQRLVSSVRKHDMLAYVGDEAFAVVLVNVDRHTAFEVSRRLRGTLSTPLAADLGETVLSVSVGLSHESGLIDAADMFEAASSAMADARHEGGARMLIAC